MSVFGADRLMWGSDRPVVEMAGGYDRWRAGSLALLDGLDTRSRDAVPAQRRGCIFSAQPAAKDGDRSRIATMPKEIDPLLTADLLWDGVAPRHANIRKVQDVLIRDRADLELNRVAEPVNP
jgi:hypothetical protein